MEANKIYNKSFKQGYNIEKLFTEICKKHNIKTEKSSQHTDMYEHIDFFMYKNGKKCSVDVKDERKKFRSDPDTAEKVIWLEIKNVNGDNGWVYGKANIIAFKHNDGFIMVNRIDLITLLEEKRLKWDDGRFKKGRDFYQTYSRDGRKDEIVMFHVADILKLKNNFLQ